MGGNTSGMLTKVSIIGLIRDFEYANQYANGTEMTNKIMVVTNASLKVRIRGSQLIIRYFSCVQELNIRNLPVFFWL